MNARQDQDERAAFDQRPGALEATRGLGTGLVVVGHRLAEPGAPGSWRALVLVTTAEGQLVQLALTPAQAERAARDLAQMAAVCREGFKDLDPGQSGCPIPSVHEGGR